MITLKMIVINALCVWAIVEVIHHGTIFAKLRAYTEAKGGFLGELIACPFCLSHWAAAFVTLCSSAHYYSNASPLVITASVLMWLATIRVANLFNDVCYKLTRTPK